MPSGAHGRHLFVPSIKRPVAMTPTLAIVVVVVVVAQGAATPAPVIVVVARLGWGLALVTNKGKNYVNEFRVSFLAWEMPFNGYQRPPNYYYDNCLTGVTSSLLG